MRRVRYYEYGGPGVLTVEETELPEPGPGQVRLRAEAIGANFVDTKIRGNAVGPGVDPARLGERVAALVDPDAFADFALADAAWLAPAPEGLPAALASLLPTAGPVALRVLRTGQVAKGETVLIHSGAGNIGG